MWETDAVGTAPDDFKLIAVDFCVISSCGGIVVAGHMNWCDVRWGVGVRVLVEGVVSECGAVWRDMSCYLPFHSARKD